MPGTRVALVQGMLVWTDTLLFTVAGGARPTLIPVGLTAPVVPIASPLIEVSPLLTERPPASEPAGGPKKKRKVGQTRRVRP